MRNCFVPALLLAIGMGQVESRGEWTLRDMLGTDSQGQVVYRPRPIDAKFANPINDADERAFQQRARQIIAAQAQMKVPAGNTYFENEKRTYGYLMAQVLAGREQAVSDLQVEDAQAQEWHRETAGIDFYACFTLKHQTRKFFYFGDLLAPEYRRRMIEGAKRWTSQDPLRRPHYAFKSAGGWGPNDRNSWVDVRSTENLYLMRVTSVYLFAEAAGNREVAAKYKDEIRRYAVALYRVGMGEWDSENYHGHSIAPLCNLYDFARDDEVRLLAKACLDWVFAAGAVKYYRGAFNGPTKRDYNHVQPFSGSAANMLHLHFGDCPVKTADWESDEVHLITSAYSSAKSISFTAGLPDKRDGFFPRGRASYPTVTFSDGTTGLIVKGGINHPISFYAHPSFASVQTRDYYVRATVRRLAAGNVGMNLRYEVADSQGRMPYANVGRWFGVSQDSTWQTYTWHCKDACLSKMWGYDFTISPEQSIPFAIGRIEVSTVPYF